MERETLVAAVLVAGLAAPGAAWDSHGRLTRAALATVPGLDAAATVETFDEYARASGLADRAALARRLKLSARAPLSFAPGETPGVLVPLRQILWAHADEPDAGGLDDGTLEEYPELRRGDFAALGPPEVSDSRAYRHIYWIDGYYLPPAPGQAGLRRVDAPLGDAPERCETLIAESRRAFASGHPYWGARFLSWGLHYAEDLSQPFHAAQVPSFSLLVRGPAGWDAPRSARSVMYFHFVWDKLPTEIADGAFGGAAQARLSAALTSGAAEEIAAGSERVYCEGQARAAAAAARRAAEAAVAVFPPAAEAGDDRSWGGLFPPGLWAAAAARASTPEGATLFETLLERIEACGAAARNLTAGVLKK